MKTSVLARLMTTAAMCIGGWAAQGQESAAVSPRRNSSSALSPAEVDLYRPAPTLIDWTPRQIHDCPFLHKLRRAPSKDQLLVILERAAQTNSRLLQDFPRVACEEEVTSDVTLLGWAKPSLAGARKFRYIVIPSPRGDLPGFEEYRTALDGSPPKLGNLAMLTSDFVFIGLYLSAAGQRDSKFRHFGIENIRHRDCQVVGFAQDPTKARIIATFTSRGASAAMPVQGVAWIDPQTFQVLRVTTWLLAPRPDVGLSAQTSTVDFFPVQPRGTARTLWLPRDVSVEGLCDGVHFHNTHHYSNFELFRVKSTIKPAS